jgi:hypothetical protein
LQKALDAVHCPLPDTAACVAMVDVVSKDPVGAPLWRKHGIGAGELIKAVLGYGYGEEWDATLADAKTLYRIGSYKECFSRVDRSRIDPTWLMRRSRETPEEELKFAMPGVSDG